nr:helix-turn-helix transcriptional regulator [Hyphomonas sp. Mor2]
MQHGDIWRGIDLLARNHGLSTSGLAKLAGLDPTAFNKSKRLPKDGRPRWPSTESLARVLNAVGVEFDEFARLVSERRGLTLPLLRQSDLDIAASFHDATQANGARVDTLTVPSDEMPGDWFVLEISDDTLETTFRAGDRLIVSPGASLREGDRLVIKPRNSGTQFGVARRVTSAQIELEGLTREAGIRAYDRSEADLIARILWASQ